MKLKSRRFCGWRLYVYQFLILYLLHTNTTYQTFIYRDCKLFMGSCFPSFCFMSPVTSVIFLQLYPISLPSKLFLTFNHKFLLSALPFIPFIFYRLLYCGNALFYILSYCIQSRQKIVRAGHVICQGMGETERMRHFTGLVVDRMKTLTLHLLTWRIWWALSNVSKGQMGFKSTFKNHHLLIKSQQNWLKQGVSQFAVRFINLLFLFGIRRNCLKNGRSRS